mgnify:CR=1 FL=1
MPASSRPRAASPRPGPRGLGHALALAVLATSLASAGSARADEADDRHQEGTALSKKGEFEAARIKLLQAASLRPMPKTFLNLCVVEQQMKLEEEAIKHCRAFLAAKDADPATAKTVHDGIFRELEQVTGRVAIEAPKGASVEVDGHLLGVAPFPGPVDLKVGERTLSVGAVSVKIAVRSGQVVTAKLVPEEPAPAPPPAAAPGAPPEPSPPPPREAPTERGSWLVPAVLAGVGVVGLGVGGGLALASSGKASSLDAARATRAGTCGPTGAECADLQSAYDAGKGLQTGSYVAYGVGGAALLGAVVVALVKAPWRERRASARSTPTLVPVLGAAPGLALQGVY